MPFEKRIYRVILSSPSDLEKERSIVKTIIEEINETYKDSPIGLQLYMWENDVIPLLTMQEGQSQIDDTLRISDSDLVIGMFFEKPGSPVFGAPSGTDHEINQAIESYKIYKRPNIMLYFKLTNKKLSSVTDDEIEKYRMIKNRKKEYMKLGIVQEFSTISQFELKIRKHLLQYMAQNNISNNGIKYERVPIKSRKEFERMEDIVAAAEKEIFILGINLEGALNIRGLLQEKSKRGIKIKLLAMEPFGKTIDAFNINNVDINERRNKIVSNLKILKTIASNNIELRTTDRIFIAGCTAIDMGSPGGRIIAQQYLNCISTSEAPILDIYYTDNAHWFEIYQQYLETLWEKYSKEVKADGKYI